MNRQTRWLSRALAAILLGLLTAMAVEGFARLVLPNKGLRPVVPVNTTQFDEKLGWSKVPLSHGVSNRTGYRVEYTINSKGLRDDETTYEKTDDRFRIVLIGDSFTFGWGVPLEKHYSTLLEGYFDNVEVINMGVEAYGIDQELLFLRLEGIRYEPDLVLAYIPGYFEHRHMYANRFGRNKPKFELSSAGLILTNTPVKNNLEDKGTLWQLNNQLILSSKAYNIGFHGLSGLIKRFQPGKQQAPEGDLDMVDAVFIEESYKLGEAIISAMQQESVENGAEFVLVTHIDRVHQYASSQQIPVLNVSKPLSNPAYRLPDNLLHINESGNGVLAWEIAKFLQENQLIPVQHIRFATP